MEHWPEENRGKDGEDSGVTIVAEFGHVGVSRRPPTMRLLLLWPLSICLFKELRLVQQ